MFSSDDEYANYKATELEGAVADIVANRRRANCIETFTREGNQMDGDGFRNAPDTPVTLWIDKVCLSQWS